jgi:hypothetical protein
VIEYAPSMDAMQEAITSLDTVKLQKLLEVISDALRREADAAEEKEKPAAVTPVAQPELPKSRFILGPVTAEEEAAFACSKAEFLEWFTEQKKKPRLREMQERFGFKNLDAARRAIKHWGYQAPTPHTFISKIK